VHIREFRRSRSGGMWWGSSNDGSCNGNISPADRDPVSSQCNKRAHSIAHPDEYSTGGDCHHGSHGNRHAN
jgi:hypothetical protein